MDLKLKDNSKLSLAFTQLEYIESTGTQWIDTRIIPTNNTKIEFKFSLVSLPSGWLFPFGGRGGTDNFNPCYAIGIKDTTRQFRLNIGNDNVSETSVFATTNIDYDIVLNAADGKNYINGILYQGTPVTVNYVRSLYLCCLNENGSSTAYNSIIKIKELIVWNDGVNITHHFYPAKDSIDGACLYDVVSQTFFYNQGIGDFIAGPVVPTTALPTTALPKTICLKTTTLYHKNTPNTNGLQLLKSILNAQEAVDGIVLNRIRVDIGNVSGSISELLQYAGLAGFNDNYEPQDKPRLVGTWAINDWYTTAQLAQAQAAFDGLTIVADPNYLIDFNHMAVQVLDDTQPNYNPAVAIILQANGYGITLSEPPISGQSGRWFLTKSDAASINLSTKMAYPGSIFFRVKNVSDTNNIIDGGTYPFESLLELKYFTSTNTIGRSCFEECGIKYIDVSNITVLDNVQCFCKSGITGEYVFNLNAIAKGAFIACTSLTKITINGNGGYSLALQGSNYANGVFSDCTSLQEVHLNENVVSLDNMTFSRATSLSLVHLIGDSVKTISGAFSNLAASCRFYVGDGSSAAHDNAILTNYLADSNWANYHSRLDTWYNFAAPHLSYDGGYVTITVQRESTIYYTTDETAPTTESMEYTEPFSWSGHGVIKAMAVNSNNDTVYAKDFYSTAVDNPNITINTTTKQIALSSTTSGSVIYYTLDGSYPTLNSSVYSGPINTTELEDIVKVMCFAVKDGMNDSEVVGKVCVMDDSLWGTDGDTSYFALQCIDPTKPNYNPAVCIILDNNNLLTDECCGGGGGYITKTDCAALTSANIRYIFATKKTLVDSKNIVSKNNNSYSFSTFNEFKYFTDYPMPSSGTDSNYCGFYNCTNLTEITLPPINPTFINHGWGNAYFKECTNLHTINNLQYLTTIPNYFAYVCINLVNFTLSNNITSIGTGAFLEVYDNKTPSSDQLIDLNFPYLTYLGPGAFQNCRLVRNVINLGTITSLPNNVNYGTFRYTQNLNEVTLPSTLTDISAMTFWNCNGNAKINLLSETPPTIDSNVSNEFYPNTIKLYVGDGSSSIHDDAILQTYLADTNWALHSSQLDTWYNYLHP